MISDRTVAGFGYAAVAVMGVCLALVGFRLVPPAWDVPLFAVAVVLFSVRLVLRTVARRRKRGETPPAGAPTDGRESTP